MECDGDEKGIIIESAIILSEKAGKIVVIRKLFNCGGKPESGFAFFAATDTEELTLHKEHVIRRKELS